MLLNKLSRPHTHTHTQEMLKTRTLRSFFSSHEHDPHLYIRLEVEQVDLLPVAAI